MTYDSRYYRFERRNDTIVPILVQCCTVDKKNLILRVTEVQWSTLPLVSVEQQDLIVSVPVPVADRDELIFEGLLTPDWMWPRTEPYLPLDDAGWEAAKLHSTECSNPWVPELFDPDFGTEIEDDY